MQSADAKRLGLDAFFSQYSDAPGTIAVLDGDTKEVVAEFFGVRDVGEYRTAVKTAMEAPSQ